MQINKDVDKVLTSDSFICACANASATRSSAIAEKPRDC